ncbi:MAG: outer membrane beta-barrel protein [Flavobacterium sp.]|uniref:outer membrane beta-barrel protein n=1 Tax=Flavobacterium sp. TaxID=239 RepID=UPI0032674062
MKKLFIVAIIALLGFTQTEAQVTFKPGLRGGVNFSHFTQGDSHTGFYGDPAFMGSYGTDFKSKTDFYVGFYGALHLTKFYTLQPEIDYSNQGSTINYIDNNNISRSAKLDVSYLSLAVINKFTFNKFNVLLGPALEFVVDEKNMNADNDIDLTFQLGAGYDVTKNFGLEARIKKGIIPSYYSNNYNGYGYYSDNNNHTNVVFSIGATYTFDIK